VSGQVQNSGWVDMNVIGVQYEQPAHLRETSTRVIDGMPTAVQIETACVYHIQPPQALVSGRRNSRSPHAPPRKVPASKSTTVRKKTARERVRRWVKESGVLATYVC
jgi:hypothetical protein